MPVTSDPKFVWPPVVSPVVGPDGVLSAKVDTVHAGVLLAADWSLRQLAPSLVDHADDWTLNGGAYVIDWAAAKDGKGLRLPDSANGDAAAYGPNISTSPGDVWELSVYGSAYSGSTATAKLRAYFYTAGSAYITSTLIANVNGQVSGTVTVPEGAAFVSFALRVSGSSAGGWWSFRDMDGHLVADVPQKVRFVRDGQPVRSGNPAYAPGGIAVAYDHEAPLGQGVSYQAVPVMADGTEGTPSDVITVEVDAPVKQTWLKSVNEPDLSIGSTEGSVANPIIVAPVDLTSAGRVETTSIQGSRFPAATWDTHEAAGGDMSVLVYTVADRDRVIALLDSGPVLVQPARNTGIGQFYCLAGDVQQSIKTYRQSVPVTELSFPVTTVGCPSTVDTPLMIPGLSYQSVAESYSTYKELGQQVPSYLALLGVDWL